MLVSTEEGARNVTKKALMSLGSFPFGPSPLGSYDPCLSPLNGLATYTRGDRGL